LFGPLLPKVRDEHFIYVPLQGHLTRHRSFQSCDPLTMLAQTCAAYPDRRIEAGLHPNEDYSDAEQDALQRLVQDMPNLQVRTGGMTDLLPGCTAVVTQNSSVAFNGYILGKPAMLFAGIDFHHIALKPDDPDAFERLPHHRPDVARYLWWFWREHAINVSDPNATDAIRRRFQDLGWAPM
jgi:hypothetical protein